MYQEIIQYYNEITFYKTTKTKYNIATDSFIFENVSLIESRFLDCEFHNIHLHLIVFLIQLKFK